MPISTATQVRFGEVHPQPSSGLEYQDVCVYVCVVVCESNQTKQHHHTFGTELVISVGN